MKKLSNEEMSVFSGGSCTITEYWEWINNPPWWAWAIPGGLGIWASQVFFSKDKCGGSIIFYLEGGGSDPYPGIL